MDKATEKLKSKETIDLIIRVGLIAYLIYLVLKVIAPFLILVIWGAILAVMLYPLQQIFAKKMGGREGRASLVIVVLGCCLIAFPLLGLSFSLAEYIGTLHQQFVDNKLAIPQPKESVAQWPVIGEKLFEAWSTAANNLPVFIGEYKKPLQLVFKQVLLMGGSVLGAMGIFIGALAVSGLMMTWAEGSDRMLKRALKRVVGEEKAPELQKLSVATIRSVASGVIGVAVIQAILFGIGFLVAGIPAASLLALIVLVLGVIQLPPTIVVLPMLIYMWTSMSHSTVMNSIFTVYFLLAGLSDNVLKPVLLGRGVNAPMPVILIGAIGGMISGGLIGLFLGPVLLAVAYQIFMDWMGDNEAKENSDDSGEDDKGSSEKKDEVTEEAVKEC